MQQSNRFNFASAMTGFAIGAIVTFIAVIAVVPAERATRSGTGSTNVSTEGGEIADDFGSGELGDATVTGGGSTSGGTSGGTRSTRGGSSSGSGGSSAGGGGGGGGGTTIPGRQAGGTGGGAAVGGGGSGGSGSGGSGNGGGGGGQCAAGQNGGKTDVGVDATSIKLGATIAESGIAKSFLGQVRQGMEAQIKKINLGGGICGRQLKVVYKDDGWNPETGARYLQNLVEGDQVFALAVSPSSEGLNQASNQGYFKSKGVPVVGADGLNATQFKDPMIWPVAAATTTTINIMMKNAADRAAAKGQPLRPAIVYGKGYRFGVEGAFAANEAFKKISGGQSIPGYENPLSNPKCDQRFCGISPEVGQYGNQVSLVKDACQMGSANECNFMILLLEPKTAQDWMAVPGVLTPTALSQRGLSMAGPQPLFTYDFGRNCGDKCDGLWLWTGYNPPIDRYKNVSQVNTFVSDLKAQSASADEFNQFTMGGYIGMQLLIEALKQVGPNLTRSALVNKLNSMAPLDTGLTTALQWRPDARYANHSAQAFKIESRNGFSGWVLQQDPIRDPWLGQHTG